MAIDECPGVRFNAHMRILAWISSVFYIGLAAVFCLGLPGLASGVTFMNPDGLAGVRTIFAGLHLGIGVAVLGFTLARLYLLAVFVAAAAATGLAVARVASMFIDNTFTTTQVRDLIPEAAGVVILVVLLPRIRAELRRLRQQ